MANISLTIAKLQAIVDAQYRGKANGRKTFHEQDLEKLRGFAEQVVSILTHPHTERGYQRELAVPIPRDGEKRKRLLHESAEDAASVRQGLVRMDALHAQRVKRASHPVRAAKSGTCTERYARPDELADRQMTELSNLANIRIGGETRTTRASAALPWNRG